ncbi:hypothetical protein B0H14DRAFT_2620580 [Mycena olivaceomarginata]|nr:hypothetical protein B0H14DRAFT_2620580 [Mycena olivaceomarginata]
MDPVHETDGPTTSVNKLVGPSEETVTLSRVKSWLPAKNLAAVPITPAGDRISVDLTAFQANVLLAADSPPSIRRQIALFALQGSIDWVHPTVRRLFGKGWPPLSRNNRSVRPPTTSASVSSDCRVNSSWTPTCIQQVYGISSTSANPAANTFLQLYRPDMDPNTTFDLLSVDGGINNQLPCGAGFNGDLDIQYTVGMATGVPVTFISTGTLQTISSLKCWTRRIICNAGTPAPNDPRYDRRSREPGLTPNGNLAGRGTSYIVQTGIWRAGGIPFPPCNLFDPPFLASCLL